MSKEEVFYFILDFPPLWGGKSRVDGPGCQNQSFYILILYSAPCGGGIADLGLGCQKRECPILFCIPRPCGAGNIGCAIRDVRRGRRQLPCGGGKNARDRRTRDFFRKATVSFYSGFPKKAGVRGSAAGGIVHIDRGRRSENRPNPGGGKMNKGRRRRREERRVSTRVFVLAELQNRAFGNFEQ